MRKSHLQLLKTAIREKRFSWLLKQALKVPLFHLDYHFGIIPRKFLGPIQGIFFVTYACNLRCYFCDLPLRHIEYVKKGDRRELSKEEKLAVIDDFCKIGTTGVGFTGGEPSLLPEIYELIERCSQKGMVSHLSTNGYAFRTPESCDRFLEAGLKATSISIDGPEPIHNSIRGRKESYNQVIQAIHNILEARLRKRASFSVVTTTVITKDNIKAIPDMVQELKKLGVDKIGFMPVHDIGLDYNVETRKKAFELSSRSPTDWLMEYLRKFEKEGLLENTPEYLDLFETAFKGDLLPIRCFAGYTTITVDSWGDIYPCFSWASMRRSCGNVLEKRLAEFWEGEEMKSVRARTKDCRECFWNCQTELNLLVSKKRVPPNPLPWTELRAK